MSPVVNVTLAIPEEIYKTMKKHPEIKWTEVMRKAAVDFAQKLEQDEFKKYGYHKSQANWVDANELFEF